MSEDEQAQRERAEQLRKQIEELKSEQEDTEEEDDAEMKPGESPREYVERRMREIFRGKRKRKK